MAGVTRQIIGSFEDIGRDIARETVNVPKDIVGTVLESLGTSLPETPATHDHQNKAFARRALEKLAGTNKQYKKPDLYEQQQQEHQQKKEAVKQQAVQNRFEQLPNVETKKRRGDFYGVRGKTHTEASKNIRQD